VAFLGRVRSHTQAFEDRDLTIIYLCRGAITLTISIMTFFRMPPSLTQTKTWFRPKGWFTEREEIIATTRILRDDPTKVRTLHCVFLWDDNKITTRETCTTEKD